MDGYSSVQRFFEFLLNPLPFMVVQISEGSLMALEGGKEEFRVRFE